MRAALALLLLVGCGSGPTIDDAGCGLPGVAADQPVIECPAVVDLGCIGAGGVPLSVNPSVATCDGSNPTVTCSPSSVSPGIATGSCTASAASGASAECTFPIRYRVEGPPQIVCEDVTVVCTGPLTPVDVPMAGVMPSCDGAEPGVPTSDAPVGGFVVGATSVVWTADVVGGSPLSCTGRVTVTDDAPPVLDCAAQTIVRTDPASAPVVTPPTALDGCDGSVDVVVPAVPMMRGAHTLAVIATDDAGNTATCDWALDVLDVFAPAGFRVLSAELLADGSTDVTLGWEATTGADVTEIRLDRATSRAGPWEELARFVPGRPTLTYTDADVPSSVQYYRLVALAGATEGGIAGPVRAFALADDEYHLLDQAVPGVPFATSLFGVVRHPRDLTSGPFPLVLFMHGNHGNCRPASLDEDECETREGHECESPGFSTTPNAQGYIYLQDTLSSQGYVTVSVSANALNCRMDFIGERVQLILEHLRRWATWGSAGGGAPFARLFSGALDLSQVALVGHSRGGEAVATAPAELRATPIPGVSLASVFAIGPTDYHTPRPSGVPYAVLLPGCDADVRTLEGLLQYDRGLDPSDPHERAQVLIVGANHNYFNTEWRFDDNERLTRVCSNAQQVGAPAQRGMLEPVLTDWVLSTTASGRAPSYLRAQSDTPALIDAWADVDLDLRWSYAAASRLVLDDFAGPGAPDVNERGGANTYLGFIASITCSGACSRNFPHLAGGVRPAWQDAMASATFAVGDLDATAYDTLSMRFASRIATINDGVSEHEFGIRVRDVSGATAEVPLSSVGRVAHRYPSAAEQEILSTVRVPLVSFTDALPTVDLAHLQSIELVMPIAGGNAGGSVWVSDLDLAND